mgnify:CR=1 FL=1
MYIKSELVLLQTGANYIFCWSGPYDSCEGIRLGVRKDVCQGVRQGVRQGVHQGVRQGVRQEFVQIF